jgi:hypothetical protein
MDEVEEMINRIGIKKMLEHMIAALSNGDQDDYVIKLTNNLITAFKDYENRYGIQKKVMMKVGVQWVVLVCEPPMNGPARIASEVTDHRIPNTKLALVEKKLGDESDLYVCYVPTDVTHGSREDNSFLFAEDGCFNAAIYADNKEFSGTLHSSVEANKKNPAFTVEYRCTEDDVNPAVFVFETINPDTEDSHVELYRGYLVRKEEVSVC